MNDVLALQYSDLNDFYIPLMRLFHKPVQSQSRLLSGVIHDACLMLYVVRKHCLLPRESGFLFLPY